MNPEISAVLLTRARGIRPRIRLERHVGSRYCDLLVDSREDPKLPWRCERYTVSAHVTGW